MVIETWPSISETTSHKRDSETRFSVSELTVFETDCSLSALQDIKIAGVFKQSPSLYLPRWVNRRYPLVAPVEIDPLAMASALPLSQLRGVKASARPVGKNEIVAESGCSMQQLGNVA